MFASSTGPAVSGGGPLMPTASHLCPFPHRLPHQRGLLSRGGTSDADSISLVSISPPFASSMGPAVSGGGTASELFSVG